MSDSFEAITFDFYNTLIFHRDGRGRGATLVEYLDAQGLPHLPWEHQILYDLFEGWHRHGSPAGDPAHPDARALLASRVFERMDVPAGPGEPARHSAALWEILGADSFEVFPEVHETLRTLRDQGFRLGVISNWQCGLVHFCTDLQLTGYFDTILSSAELGIDKPDGRIFAEACRRLGVAPERTAHVGDTFVDDYEGARDAGLTPVLVNRTGVPAPPIERVIQSLSQLSRVLRAEPIAMAQGEIE